MPNTGRPSKDCHACRRRRVKCDLTRPGCNRCAKVKQPCPGYRDELELLFRHENTHSLAQSSSRDGRRRKYISDITTDDAAADSSGSDCKHTSTIIRHRSTPGTLVFRTPKRFDHPRGLSIRSTGSTPLSWQEQAIPIVLSEFVAPITDRHDWRENRLLPSILAGAKADSAIVKTCQALGLAYLGNKSMLEQGTKHRAAAYSKALLATNALLRDEHGQKSDEAAMCVFLLSLCELLSPFVTHDRRAGTLSWAVHTRGLIELLRIRGPEQLRKQRSRDLFWTLLVTIQIRAYLAGIEVPAFLEQWLSDNQEYFASSDIKLYALARFSFEGARLCAKIQSMVDAQNSTAWELEAVAVWSEIKALELVMTTQLLTEPSQAPLDFARIYRHNYYRAFLCKTMLYHYEMLHADAARPKGEAPSNLVYSMATEIRNSIQRLADATITTIPYVLGSSALPVWTQSSLFKPLSQSEPPRWADTLRLFWPLSVLASRHTVLQHHQAKTIEQALNIIGRDLGIQRAVLGFVNGTQELLGESTRCHEESTQQLGDLLKDARAFRKALLADSTLANF